MEINLFFEPVNKPLIEKYREAGNKRVVDLIEIYTDKGNFPDFDQKHIALIGVCEGRQSIDNEGTAHAPDVIREQFYKLFHHWPNLKIVDFGNIRQGHTVEDTYFALSQVIGVLIRNKVLPIILGGSQDLTYANYMAYENIGQLVNIVSVDPSFDLGKEEEPLNSRSYLSKIIMHQPNYLFNFTNLGYQTYLIEYESVDLMKNLLFDVYRLGAIKSNIAEAEPIVRNADILSFDISSVRASDAPGNSNAGPNGFTGEEACRIARYAGMSDKLSSIGFYETNPIFDLQQVTSQLVAQMIWYFIEGFVNRKNDLPVSGSHDFAKYIVKNESQDEEIVFLKSKKTDRWWIDLSYGREQNKQFERHYFVPCSKEDYELAKKEEIPDRWWQFYQKLM
ncbi:MAG: formimidoylglutamase [Bacteroidales bacterium]|nr:formimidoylglutamase [Bacteroidales bacterium]